MGTLAARRDILLFSIELRTVLGHETMKRYYTGVFRLLPVFFLATTLKSPMYKNKHSNYTNKHRKSFAGYGVTFMNGKLNFSLPFRLIRAILDCSA